MFCTGCGNLLQGEFSTFAPEAAFSELDKGVNEIRQVLIGITDQGYAKDDCIVCGVLGCCIQRRTYDEWMRYIGICPEHGCIGGCGCNKDGCIYALWTHHAVLTAFLVGYACYSAKGVPEPSAQGCAFIARHKDTVLRLQMKIKHCGFQLWKQLSIGIHGNCSFRQSCGKFMSVSLNVCRSSTLVLVRILLKVLSLRGAVPCAKIDALRAFQESLFA